MTDPMNDMPETHGAFARWLDKTRALGRALDDWITATRGLSTAIGGAVALGLGELAGVVDVDLSALAALFGGGG